MVNDERRNPSRYEFDQIVKRLDEHCETQNNSLGKIWDKLDGIDSRLTKVQITALERESQRITRAQALIYSALTLVIGIAFTVIGFLVRG